MRTTTAGHLLLLQERGWLLIEGLARVYYWPPNETSALVKVTIGIGRTLGMDFVKDGDGYVLTYGDDARALVEAINEHREVLAAEGAARLDLLKDIAVDIAPAYVGPGKVPRWFKEGLRAIREKAEQESKPPRRR